MWHLSVPWWEFAARAAIVYAFLLVILRFTGRRQVGQLAPFDLVLLLVLSNTVQNAMNAGDNSVAAGLILATSIIALNSLLALLTWKSKRLESLVEGRPQVLVHNGKVDLRALARERLTHHELMAALRAAGCTALDDVQFAILENNGRISVIPRDRAGLT
jgi:uncharacterized membrane protein YcaP (DUF421 family)